MIIHPTKRLPYGSRSLLNPGLAIFVREWFIERIEKKENRATTLTDFYNDYKKYSGFENNASKPIFNRLLQEVLNEESTHILVSKRPSIIFYGIFLKD